ncbi:MAG TPA: DUF4198 domain-containing protein [Thermoanaerobaculia bacterium]|nr:DUF4198 domain-containing protein [Thermoanaerobaculia bacterium]
MSLRSLPSWLPLAAALCLWLEVSPLEAHELYIRPSSFRPPAGERVGLALEVGHAFAGSPVERRPGHLRRFVWMGSDGETREVRGVDGALPAGWVVGAPEGLVTVSYESHAMHHELPPARFESYLREEGLDEILALRRDRGETSAAGRELFSRCAKTVLAVGDAGVAGRAPEGAVVAPGVTGRGVRDAATASPGGMPAIGCPLELVPVAGLLDSGSQLTVRVLWEGNPLPGVLVRATRAGELAASAALRSSSVGLATFDLDDGAWLLHAVHMTPLAPGGAGSEAADWRSVWTSLTFERRSE